jgi:hypothetical protein
MNQSTPSTLAPLPPHPSSLDVSDNFRAVEQYLQPADGGPAAWRLLGAAFVFEALLWGKVFFLPDQKNET